MIGALCPCSYRSDFPSFSVVILCRPLLRKAKYANGENDLSPIAFNKG